MECEMFRVSAPCMGRYMSADVEVAVMTDGCIRFENGGCKDMQSQKQLYLVRIE